MPGWLGWLKGHLMISAQVLMAVCSISALGSTLGRSLLKKQNQTQNTFYIYFPIFIALVSSVLIRKHETMSVSCIRFLSEGPDLEGGEFCPVRTP